MYVLASCRGDLKRVADTQAQSRDKDNSNEVYKTKGRRGPSEGYFSLCSPSLLQPDGGTVSPNALRLSLPVVASAMLVWRLDVFRSVARGIGQGNGVPPG
jgi:hypothetical protein